MSLIAEKDNYVFTERICKCWIPVLFMLSVLTWTHGEGKEKSSDISRGLLGKMTTQKRKTSELDGWQRCKLGSPPGLMFWSQKKHLGMLLRILLYDLSSWCSTEGNVLQVLSARTDVSLWTAVLYTFLLHNTRVSLLLQVILSIILFHYKWQLRKSNICDLTTQQDGKIKCGISKAF